MKLAIWFGRLFAFAMLLITMQAVTAVAQFDLPDLGTFGQKASASKAVAKAYLEARPTQYEQARKTMSAAVEIVFGKALEEGGYNSMPNPLANLGLGNKSARTEAAQNFFIYSIATNQTPKYKGKFDAGLKIIDAVEWLKEHVLGAKDNVEWRNNVVEFAFFEVYGRAPTSAELTDYNQKIVARKAWSTSIVFEENKRLSKDTTERKGMIERVYRAAFGRSAKPDEVNYWLPRGQNFLGLLGVSRSYLYSDAGAIDLRETIVRAEIKKGKGEPQGDKLQKLTVYYKMNPMIYSEMIAVP